MDPLTWINAGSSLLNAVGGLNGKNAEPGIASSGGTAALNTDVDFSGFTVATGNAKASGAKINKTSSDGIGTPAASLSGMLGDVSPVVLIVGAVALVLVWRRMSK